MKKVLSIVIIIIALVLISFGVYFYLLSSKSNKIANTASYKAKTMLIIKSPAFQNSSKIPQKFTCDGDSINPPLEISGVPKNTKSLALIVEDPDAPRGTWVHWVKWNISPITAFIKEGENPGVSGSGTSGKLEYEGPCPPSGTHRYIFRVCALDEMLNLPKGSDAQTLRKNMEGHIIAEGELIGLYGR
jgi:Raf kinase inhibitor-like YbhB/YbcL family protein